MRGFGELLRAGQKSADWTADQFDMSATRTSSAASTAGRSSESAGRTPDRRRSEREPHPVTATLQPANGNTDAEDTVAVRDLSLGGVGLACDRRYAAGTVWRITFGNGPMLLNAKIRVVSCRKRSDKRYDVGCEFC